jgi:hypothetical protein
LYTRETHSLLMTEKGKLNVRCHELRHFNIIIPTFSTDFASLMCSGVQTIRKKTQILRDAGTGSGAQLCNAFKFDDEKLREDASRQTF